MSYCCVSKRGEIIVPYRRVRSFAQSHEGTMQRTRRMTARQKKETEKGNLNILFDDVT